MPLYIINFNESSLCGGSGCLYVGYIPATERFQQVFGIYLIQSEITVSERMSHGLPCLNFPVPPNDTATWCYDGLKYQLSK